MEIDETPEDPDISKPNDAAGSTQVAKAVDRKLLPFGSGLLPTSSGRGNLLNQVPITDIEKGMQEGLYEGRGVLGKVSLRRVLIATMNIFLIFLFPFRSVPIPASRPTFASGKRKNRSTLTFRQVLYT